MKQLHIREKKEVDESLFGLLSPYKQFNTYIRVFINDAEKKIKLQLTNNPSNWQFVEEGSLDNYRLLKRVELGIQKISVKFLYPENIVAHLGPTFGLKIPDSKIHIENHLLDEEKKYFSITIHIKYLAHLNTVIKKIINYSPQKKYEILEKYYSGKV